MCKNQKICQSSIPVQQSGPVFVPSPACDPTTSNGPALGLGVCLHVQNKINMGWPPTLLGHILPILCLCDGMDPTALYSTVIFHYRDNIVI